MNSPSANSLSFSTPYRVLVSDKLGDDGVALLTEANDVDVDIRTGLSHSDLCELISDYDALIIRSGTQVNAEVLQVAGQLKVIGRAGVGTDNVDVGEATRRGVIVMNTPDANTIATAEHAFALLLASARNVAQAHRSMTQGKWDRSSFTGVEVKGKTLGIVGFGRVGRAVASRAQAFGMKVLAYDPFVTEKAARDFKVELAELDDVLATSDFVTLHTSLSEDTRNLINAERLMLMKPNATIVNAARGGLVDADAVAAALDADRLRSIAIDVYDVEPPEADHPLVGHPKVVHTPHLGASTAEAQRGVSVEVVEQVLDALRGIKVANSVNLAFPPGLDFARANTFITLAANMGRLQAAMADGQVTSVEVEVYGEDAEDLIKPTAAGLLQGLLSSSLADGVNFVNAPVIAQEKGLKVSRSVGLGRPDFTNQITCNVTWDDGERLMSGAVLDDSSGRVVQISGYRLEAEPVGPVLIMLNSDVPGVIAAVGGVFAEYGINIGEWRLGRDKAQNQALSFINLDAAPDGDVVESLRALDAIQKAIIVDF